jgi:hypothetical protein
VARNKRKRGKRARALRLYLAATRRLASSYIFVVPLVVLYEVGIALDPRARSGADAIFDDLFGRFSHLHLLAINFALLGLLFLAIWRTRGQRIRVRGLYGGMLLESCLWTCALLVVAHFFPPKELSLEPLARDIVASIGAGVYEETIFRFLLMGGLVLIFQRLLGGHLSWAVPLAIGISAALFSYAHHRIGGEPWSRQVFLFRAMMGALLGALYWFRGLGIVVWVHALYNVAIVSSHG